MTVLLLLVAYWKFTLSVIGALWLWRYVAGWRDHGRGWTFRATNFCAVKVGRWVVPEKPVHRRHHDVNPDPRAFSPEQRAKLIRRDGNQCRCPGCPRHPGPCGAVDGAPGVRLECDHRHPWSQGGRTNLSNGQMLCGPCNRAKGARIVEPDGRTWAA